MIKLYSQPTALPRSLCFVLFLLCVLSPGHLHAATLNVGPGQTYLTIADGIAAAVSGDIVQVYPNDSNIPYHEDITLKNGVTIEGIETARTIIDGTGTANTVTVVNNSAIRNMTIMNTNTATGSSAVFISGVNTATITNNLVVGSDTGVECVSSLNLTITNNTIDGNATGIACSGTISIMTFENNIVSNNTIGIDFSSVSSITGTINYNDVYNNGSNLSYTSGASDSSLDPSFVDPTINDYHLQTGSACLDTGDPATSFDDKEVMVLPVDHSQNDCGAYGGSHRDTTPFQVRNVLPTTSGTDTIALQWDANLAYDIANYKIYFDNRNHNIITNVPTPLYGNILTVPATPANCPSMPAPPICTMTISGLALTAPANLRVNFGDQKLFLEWDAPSTNASLVTGYNVYYMEQSGSSWIQIGVGNTTSYTLTGLTNFTTYDIKVTAVASPTFFINVTALDDYTSPHESKLLVPDVSATISCSAPSCESPDSTVESNFPEPIAPFPDLPDQGRCFIATAAYGSPWEPQVEILRVFRDEYLEPYDWGRRFIAWYYHASPPWAQYLNEHAWLKPVVRVALIPAVGVAYYFVKTTSSIRFLSLFLMLCMLGAMFVMRKAKRCRG